MKCRVSAVQFGVGTDVAENLKTCLRMIDEAAKISPNFIVLPEFSNHCAIYESQEYADNVALDLDGDFLQTIADKALEHNTYIKINVTLKNPKDKPTVSNLLYSPKGKLVGRADKQVLMGNENVNCSRAKTSGDIVETEFGKVGMYCCADGLLMETTRLLAIRGAKLLLNSLNSFAEDEASLHIPVRAAENKVFVVASCKVDYLVPKEILTVFAEKMKIKPEALQGAGESQIVAPDGTVLAKAKRTGEDVVFADIDLTQAKPEIALQNRRPEIYKAIADEPKERNYQTGCSVMAVAAFQIDDIDENFQDKVFEAISEACKNRCGLIVLPELFGNNLNIQQISDELKNYNLDRFVVTSMRENDAHVGVLISKGGIVFRQKQIHKSNQHKWITDLGNNLETIQLPFGRLAIIVGEDSLYPETFRLAAYQNAEVVAVPFNVQERWETEFGLLERSVENRISIVAATQPNKNLGKYGNSLITTISKDFTLWTEWNNRPFDGNINYPIVTRASEFYSFPHAEICPANSENRYVSKGTDVVDGRAFWLLKPLTE
jgi:predicted amidohydrolase